MEQPTGRSATVVVVMDDETEVVVGRLTAGGADLAVVDALAWLALAASRHGWRMCLREVPEELAGLLELVGLTDALSGPDGPEGRKPGTAPHR